MMFFHPAGLLGLLLLAPSTVPPMTDAATPTEARALSLDVQERDGTLEVRLIGYSDQSLRVSYALEVSGRSTSRHRGATTLTAGTTAILSTMRASAGETWCVALTAEEEGRAPYEITHGSCTDA